MSISIPGNRFAARVRALSTGVLFALAAVACAQNHPAPSQVKIRNGSEVSDANSGPERYATAGLTIFSSQGTFTCSAAIIAEDLLVTAGHCVTVGAQIYAYFGANMQKAEASEFIAVDGSVVHPDYDASLNTGDLPPNDVAILHLTQPIPNGYQPLPILPIEGALRTDLPVELAGYGITERGNDSGVLRYVRTTYIGPDQKGRLQINDPSKRGACSGDSGGPLFGQVNGATYVAGVLSGGPIPCRGINLYTSLAVQHPFLDQAAANFRVTLQ